MTDPRSHSEEGEEERYLNLGPCDSQAVLSVSVQGHEQMYMPTSFWARGS